ncbi:MAG TPA: hypothetical protein VFS10_16975 [Pyrinomonadaceae bacterium]|nr:hypothetical protein [Pyrinomonadaceae bacterium]
MKSEGALAEREFAAGVGARPVEPATDEAGAGETQAAASSPTVEPPPVPQPSTSLEPPATAESQELPESLPPPPPESPCPSCLETLVGEFCHHCGEKSRGSRDLSLRHFAAEATQELTSVEHSKLWRTLRALLSTTSPCSARSAP